MTMLTHPTCRGFRVRFRYSKTTAHRGNTRYRQHDIRHPRRRSRHVRCYFQNKGSDNAVEIADRGGTCLPDEDGNIQILFSRMDCKNDTVDVEPVSEPWWYQIMVERLEILGDRDGATVQLRDNGECQM